MAPKLAVSDSMFIAIAFRGSTMEPNTRNNTRVMAPAMNATIAGVY